LAAQRKDSIRPFSEDITFFGKPMPSSPRARIAWAVLARGGTYQPRITHAA
jgi:hypothetical protein